MKALLALVVLLASTQVIADDLHIVRVDRIESFQGCTTTRLYITTNQAHLAMFCRAPPIVRKNPDGLTKPGTTMAWDWYVSDGQHVHMGEGCMVRAHFEGAYSGAVTELECRP